MADRTATAGRLVGREREIAAVLGAVQRDGACLVVGEAGVGKTSLVRAAVAAAARTLHEGGAFATLAWMPYLALARATGRRLDGDPAWVAGETEAAIGPDVLFVDDLQWADSGTIEALRALAGRVAVVGAIRRGTATADAVEETLVGAGFETLVLEPLDEDAGAAVALAARPDLGPERSLAIARRGAGNPFLIAELASTGQPSASLRRAIAARLEPLGDDARQSAILLALAERPVVSACLPGADELQRAGLAIATDGGLTVRHGLLADELLAAATADETRAAHGRLAVLLDDPGERARHLAAAGETDAAHELAMRAATEAVTPGERAAHLGVAAATAGGSEADTLRIEAAAALAAVESTEPELRARVEAIRARIEWSRGDPDAMRAALERGLDLVAGRATVAEALLRAEAVTVTALVDGRFDEGLRDADAAVALARSAGADPTRALLLRATILAGLGRPGWDSALEAVIASAREAADPETELSAANNLVTGHEMHGRPAEGRALASAMLQRAASLRLGAWERQFSAMLANLDLHAGDLRGALARAQALLEEALDPLATQQVGLIAALALVDLGRHEEALALLSGLLETAAPDVTGRGDVLFVLAEAWLWSGRPAEALGHLDAYRDYEASEYPTSFLVDVTAAWAAIEAGRPIPAALAKGEPSGMLVGAALEREALEALADADHGRAADRFRAAASAYEGFHRRGQLRARWASAEARRLAGEDSPARAALEAAERDASEAGFGPLLGRIQRSLRLLGVRRAVRSATVDRSSRLTPRERDLAELVGRGLTNPEIARRMGLGRPTVARLLSNAMLKAGVDSRAQLAARLEDLV